MGNSRLLNVCRVMFLLILFLTGLAVATEFYLPPSIYRTLSTRHRSLFPQPAYQDIKVTAHVAHKIELEGNVSVTLYYGRNVGVYDSLSMNIVECGKWETKIPGWQVNASKIYYYFQVWDGVMRTTAPPLSPETKPYIFDIDFAFDETAPPLIALMPRTAKMDSVPQCANKEIPLFIYVVDDSVQSIDKVKIHHNRASEPLELKRRSDYMWSQQISEPAVTEDIFYFITASGRDSPDTLRYPAFPNTFRIRVEYDSCSLTQPYIELSDETKRMARGNAPKLPYLQPIRISAHVNSSTSVPEGAVNLYFKTDSLTDYICIPFMKTEDESIWEAEIPASAAVAGRIQFYAEVVQGKDEATDPFWDERIHSYELKIKSPNAPPIIQRTPRTRALSDEAQQSGESFMIEAVITDTLGPGMSDAGLFYKRQEDIEFTRATMFANGDSIYQVQIPAEEVRVGLLEYYIWATDGEESSTDPNRNLNPDSTYHIEIKNLNAPPVITLTPATAALSHSPQPARIEIVIEAFIVDTLGPDVQSAILLYRRDNNDYSPRTMNHVADSTWHAVLPANTVLPDTLYYYISATDGDSTGHSPKPPPAPWEQPHKIAVIMNNDLPVIIHTPPVSATVDSTINISAQVIDSTLAVEFVELRYRNVKCDFKSLRMTFDQNQYIAAIPGADVIEPFVKYYIFAKGSYSPDDTTQSPVYTVPIIKPHIVRPNPFTPNNDGYNDMVTFNFEGLNSGGEVVIYNRRGRMVRRLYSGEPWDGRDDAGAELPPDVYLYAVTIDGELQRSGTLTLIR